MDKLELLVVKVCNDPQECEGCRGKCILANDEFPQLVGYVEDTCESFVLNVADGRFWQVSEFLLENGSISSLWIDAEELEPRACHGCIQ